MIVTGLIAVFGILLIAAAVSDARQLRIPNGLNASIAGLWILYVLAGHASGSGVADVGPTLAIAGLVMLAGSVLFFLRMVGGGDVKMLAAVALWAGPSELFDFLVVTALAGGLVSAAVWGQARFQTVAQFAAKPDAASKCDAPQGARLQVPYGVAIASGGLVVAGQLIFNAF